MLANALSLSVFFALLWSLHVRNWLNERVISFLLALSFSFARVSRYTIPYHTTALPTSCASHRGLGAYFHRFVGEQNFGFLAGPCLLHPAFS
jgi:hypothetical protein